MWVGKKIFFIETQNMEQENIGARKHRGLQGKWFFSIINCTTQT
jgi:hypothetical protein